MHELEGLEVQTMYELEARLLASLAHPNRLIILEYLQKGEKCVCELQAALSIEQSNLSRHLKVMAQEGLIELHRVGTRSYYRIAEPRAAVLRATAAEIVRSRLQRVANLAEAQ
ncbi:MAG: metalloregulator ArsR/SmtB family transcription factor [candidate division KSB1 bacterium]|nr:metalloregulator ArsR/SmtB family transcription factor [candidate division KSB1 bacterium]